MPTATPTTLHSPNPGCSKNPGSSLLETPNVQTPSTQPKINFRGNNVRVGVRVKPSKRGDVAVLVEDTRRLLRIVSPVSQQFRDYAFDVVYHPSVNNSDLAAEFVSPLLDAVKQGEAGTVLCYGQTGSGKTHTMGMMPALDEESDGIVPYCLQALFKTNEYDVRLEFLQQYLDCVYDLFDDSRNLQVRELPGVGVVVEGTTLVQVDDLSDATEVLALALKNRRIGEVHLDNNSLPIGTGRDGNNNADSAESTPDVRDNSSVGYTRHLSSRSHALLTVHVKRKSDHTSNVHPVNKRGGQSNGWGKLVLGDLAGSERNNAVHAAGVMHKTKIKEAKSINASLASLGNVISNLAKKSQHVPWRDSKLTKLLWDSLGTGSVHVLCTVHADKECVSETVSSLGFATRCKRIQIPQRSEKSFQMDQIDRLKYVSENKSIMDMLLKSQNVHSKEEVQALHKEIKNLKEENQRLIQEKTIPQAPSSVANESMLRATASSTGSWSPSAGQLNGNLVSQGTDNVNFGKQPVRGQDVTQSDHASQNPSQSPSQSGVIPNANGNVASISSGQGPEGNGGGSVNTISVNTSVTGNDLPGSSSSLGNVVRTCSSEPRQRQQESAPPTDLKIFQSVDDTLLPSTIRATLAECSPLQQRQSLNGVPITAANTEVRTLIQEPVNIGTTLGNSVTGKNLDRFANDGQSHTGLINQGSVNNAIMHTNTHSNNAIMHTGSVLHTGNDNDRSVQNLDREALSRFLTEHLVASRNHSDQMSDAESNKESQMRQWIHTLLDAFDSEIIEGREETSSTSERRDDFLAQIFRQAPAGCEDLSSRAQRVIAEVKNLKTYAAVQKNLSDDLIQHAAMEVQRKKTGTPALPGSVPMVLPGLSSLLRQNNVAQRSGDGLSVGTGTSMLMSPAILSNYSPAKLSTASSHHQAGHLLGQQSNAIAPSQGYSNAMMRHDMPAEQHLMHHQQQQNFMHTHHQQQQNILLQQQQHQQNMLDQQYASSQQQMYQQQAERLPSSNSSIGSGRKKRTITLKDMEGFPPSSASTHSQDGFQIPYDTSSSSSSGRKREMKLREIPGGPPMPRQLPGSIPRLKMNLEDSTKAMSARDSSARDGASSPATTTGGSSSSKDNARAPSQPIRTSDNVLNLNTLEAPVQKRNSFRREMTFSEKKKAKGEQREDINQDLERGVLNLDRLQAPSSSNSSNAGPGITDQESNGNGVASDYSELPFDSVATRKPGLKTPKRKSRRNSKGRAGKDGSADHDTSAEKLSDRKDILDEAFVLEKPDISLEQPPGRRSSASIQLRGDNNLVHGVDDKIRSCLAATIDFDAEEHGEEYRKLAATNSANTVGALSSHSSVTSFGKKLNKIRDGLDKLTVGMQGGSKKSMYPASNSNSLTINQNPALETSFEGSNLAIAMSVANEGAADGGVSEPTAQCGIANTNHPSTGIPRVKKSASPIPVPRETISNGFWGNGGNTMIPRVKSYAKEDTLQSNYAKEELVDDIRVVGFQSGYPSSIPPHPASNATSSLQDGHTMTPLNHVGFTNKQQVTVQNYSEGQPGLMTNATFSSNSKASTYAPGGPTPPTTGRTGGAAVISQPIVQQLGTASSVVGPSSSITQPGNTTPGRSPAMGVRIFPTQNTNILQNATALVTNNHNVFVQKRETSQSTTPRISVVTPGGGVISGITPPGATPSATPRVQQTLTPRVVTPGGQVRTPSGQPQQVPTFFPQQQVNASANHSQWFTPNNRLTPGATPNATPAAQSTRSSELSSIVRSTPRGEGLPNGFAQGAVQQTGGLVQPTGSLVHPTGSLVQPTGGLVQATGGLFQRAVNRTPPSQNVTEQGGNKDLKPPKANSPTIKVTLSPKKSPIKTALQQQPLSEIEGSASPFKPGSISPIKQLMPPAISPRPLQSQPGVMNSTSPRPASEEQTGMSGYQQQQSIAQGNAAAFSPQPPRQKAKQHHTRLSGGLIVRSPEKKPFVRNSVERHGSMQRSTLQPPLIPTGIGRSTLPATMPRAAGGANTPLGGIASLARPDSAGRRSNMIPLVKRTYNNAGQQIRRKSIESATTGMTFNQKIEYLSGGKERSATDQSVKTEVEEYNH